MASHGSLQNLLAGTPRGTVPTVGMGATAISWTDRHPYTVVAVLSPTRIMVRADNYERTDTNGMSESQTYGFSPGPEGHDEMVTLRRNGQWVRKGDTMKGAKFVLGYREAYHDYSF